MDSPPPPLVVAITTRALFHLEDSHALFEREGIDAYADFQRQHEDDVRRLDDRIPLSKLMHRAERV